jgi:hypothetical protein
MCAEVWLTGHPCRAGRPVDQTTGRTHALTSARPGATDRRPAWHGGAPPISGRRSASRQHPATPSPDATSDSDGDYGDSDGQEPVSPPSVRHPAISPDVIPSGCTDREKNVAPGSPGLGPLPAVPPKSRFSASAPASPTAARTPAASAARHVASSPWSQECYLPALRLSWEPGDIPGCGRDLGRMCVGVGSRQLSPAPDRPTPPELPLTRNEGSPVRIRATDKRYPNVARDLPANA